MPLKIESQPNLSKLISIYSFIYLCLIYLSIYLSISVYSYISICPYLSQFASIYLSVYPSLLLHIYQFISILTYKSLHIYSPAQTPTHLQTSRHTHTLRAHTHTHTRARKLLTHLFLHMCYHKQQREKLSPSSTFKNPLPLLQHLTLLSLFPSVKCVRVGETNMIRKGKLLFQSSTLNLLQFLTNIRGAALTSTDPLIFFTKKPTPFFLYTHAHTGENAANIFTHLQQTKFRSLKKYKSQFEM